MINISRADRGIILPGYRQATVLDPGKIRRLFKKGDYVVLPKPSWIPASAENALGLVTCVSRKRQAVLVMLISHKDQYHSDPLQGAPSYWYIPEVLRTLDPKVETEAVQIAAALLVGA